MKLRNDSSLRLIGNQRRLPVRSERLASSLEKCCGVKASRPRLLTGLRASRLAPGFPSRRVCAKLAQ
jgi:hypothetical protein